MKYSRKRVNEQTQMPSLKYIEVPQGTKLTFEEIMDGEFEQNGRKVANDTIKATSSDGRTIKLPVREFLKMDISGDGKHYKGETGSEEVKLPTAITIVKSEDRKDRNGNTVYPLFSYKKSDEFLAEGSTMTWDELVAGDIKEDNTFKPVQNYTIEVEH